MISHPSGFSCFVSPSPGSSENRLLSKLLYLGSTYLASRPVQNNLSKSYSKSLNIVDIFRMYDLKPHFDLIIKRHCRSNPAITDCLRNSRLMFLKIIFEKSQIDNMESSKYLSLFEPPLQFPLKFPYKKRN